MSGKYSFLKRAAAMALILAFVSPASAQQALAPWFDSDGFYNRAGAELSRVTADMAACRIEAARLKNVRSSSSPGMAATAFNADGSFNPGVSLAATGIASVLTAIQDARYNGSIEKIEFRDCAVALGYRHYRLGDDDRAQFDATADQGFAALISAAAPSAGRFNDSETPRNYFAADLAERPYQNPPPPAALAPAASAEPDVTAAIIESVEAATQTARPEAVIVTRLAPGVNATPREGMAIVVASARQRSAAVPVMGDTFRFTRVSEEGAFLELLQPTTIFALRSHMNSERRRDPTLAGGIGDARYSTYEIPAGRYALSALGSVNSCLGTLTFEVRSGDVVYLGDFVLRPPGIPMGSLLSPVGNVRSGMDVRLREDLRVGIGDEFEAARAALQADDAVRAQLTRVSYQSGYRLPCDGGYIGRAVNPAWPEFNASQAAAFHDAMAAALEASR